MLLRVVGSIWAEACKRVQKGPSFHATLVLLGRPFALLAFCWSLLGSLALLLRLFFPCFGVLGALVALLGLFWALLRSSCAFFGFSVPLVSSQPPKQHLAHWRASLGPPKGAPESSENAVQRKSPE